MVQFSWSSDWKCLLSVQTQLNAVCFSLQSWFDFPVLSVILEVLCSAAQFPVCTHQVRSFWCEVHGAEPACCSHLLQDSSTRKRKEAHLLWEVSSHCDILKGSPAKGSDHMQMPKQKARGTGGEGGILLFKFFTHYSNNFHGNHWKLLMSNNVTIYVGIFFTLNIHIIFRSQLYHRHTIIILTANLYSISITYC